MKTYYDIEVDFGPGARIEVVGEGQDGHYEWRLIREGSQTVETTLGYGSPEIALRDGLCFVYGLPTDDLEFAVNGKHVLTMQRTLG